MQQGKAIIFSAPSGSGKTTIVQHLNSQFPELEFSISATTRKPRKGVEEHGVHYYFISEEEFRSKIDTDDLVEWEEVYGGNFYGTLKSEVERIWALGKVVIFDVDVKGGLKLKKFFGDNALAVFVKVPDFDTLKQRLQKRKTETERDLEIRLSKAREEMKFEPFFDIALINKNLEDSFKEAEKLIGDFIAK